jgi:hypothetical protein
MHSPESSEQERAPELVAKSLRAKNSCAPNSCAQNEKPGAKAGLIDHEKGVSVAASGVHA